ncbi:hypothetical protein GMORB2_6684 [Geosmithia morbida]|uniref:Yap-binding protein n=1 Tax=Geosmithia morbida TaxID=1094350 RepID=A0A9P5D444_9HYPO|nr:uncharacterized protein GMORB2_6684 [Geosmithia morbida]KAF4123136.1 hypothetical protein GMORB2_6684 [Geosmithia morbida]
MADTTTTGDIIQRLRDSRPPATDGFTYLTIIEKSLSPEILPALGEILDSAELTNDIGWDLVDMLVPVPGSSVCLEKIARLGNPREVILKVLEVMDKTAAAEASRKQEEEAEAEVETETEAARRKLLGSAGANDKFVALVGMLKILHGRLQVKKPSRFLHTTLDTVLRAYDATSSAATAAIVDLVRSLSGQRRPALPTRQSSTRLDTPFQATDPTQTAPDPEADKTEGQPYAPEEEDLVRRLLQSFVTCIIEAYVNSNSLEWASRLLEYTVPERIVPRRPTMMQAYNEVESLQAMDALPVTEPLAADDPEEGEATDAEAVIKLSTGGFTCLAAYWMFSSDVFDAHHANVDVDVFPELHLLLRSLVGDEDPQAAIASNPGTFEALIVMAVWLDSHRGTVPRSSSAVADNDEVDIMSYLHLLTLVSVFHSNIRVRNAATFMAGSVLHADPDEGDRLAILEDLMENCMFSALQACAVSWLKEEIMAAASGGRGSGGGRGEGGGEGRGEGTTRALFAGPECFDRLQYTVFPDLKHLDDADSQAVWDYWTQASPLLLQVANFALYLFGGAQQATSPLRDVVPQGLATTVEHRYVEPLGRAANRLTEALDKGQITAGDPGSTADAKMQLGILADTLGRVPLQ